MIALSEEQANAGAAARNSQVDASRTITIEFDANARGRGISDRSRRRSMCIPGQLTTVMYSFHNRQSRAMAVQAIPSYAPSVAMAHFTKLECFCFSQQVLQAGEAKRWPVVFYVDSKLPKDVNTITLSYTFFEVGRKVPAEPVAALQAKAGPRYNRQMQDKVGFFVVTPFFSTDRAKRCWCSAADRAQLQRDRTSCRRSRRRVATSRSKAQATAGAAVRVQRRGEDRSGKCRADFVRAGNRDCLLPLSVMESGTAANAHDGLERHWPPPATGVQINYGYAFQWFAIGAVIAFLYVWFRIIRPRQRRRA